MKDFFWDRQIARYLGQVGRRRDRRIQRGSLPGGPLETATPGVIARRGHERLPIMPEFYRPQLLRASGLKSGDMAMMRRPPGLNGIDLSDPDADQAPSPLLLTARQAAAMCGKSLRTWRTWDAAGWIPRPVRIGRSTLWRADELRDWVAAGCPRRTEWEART
jgi:predicted DNA-binding transcriptional regulator AlpA